MVEENSIISRNYNYIKDKLSMDNLSKNDLKNLLEEAKLIQTQYKGLQLVVKRNANSLYGVSASKFFSLYDFDIAEDITMTGKHYCVLADLAINNFFVNWGDNNELQIIQEFYPQVKKLRKFTEYKRDTKNDLCVYGDTDSRYIDIGKIYSLLILEDGSSLKLPKLDNKELSDFILFLDKHFISNAINKALTDDIEFRNGRVGHLNMTLEVIGIKSIFYKKKKYILTKAWEDGKLLNKTKIKWQGVELKRGSTSERMKKILGILIEKFLIQNFSVEDIRIECLKLIRYIKNSNQKDFIYQITSVNGVNEIYFNEQTKKYESNKNHIQMQVALSWCNFIYENNLQDQYKPAFNGQKMNFYYCSANNKYKVIGIPDDVNLNNIPNLPEPDWNININNTLMRPLLKYIYNFDNLDKIGDNHIEQFLIGIKKIF